MALQEQAPRAGGRVEVLLGNHEAWNLIADLHDTSREAIAEFAGAEAEQRIEEAYRAWEEWARKRGELLARVEQPLPDLDREGWLAAHPAGYPEYLDALGPEGRYGRWLRGLPVAVQVGETLFVHGGVAPDLEAWSVEEMNRRMREELEQLDRCRLMMLKEGLLAPTASGWQMFAAAAGELLRLRDRLDSLPEMEQSRGRALRRGYLRDYERIYECVGGHETWYVVDEESPVSFRGYALWDEEEGADRVTAILARLGVKRVVAAHSTLASGRIRARFGARVFLLDTGMWSDDPSLVGTASALEIEGGRVTALYLDGEEVLAGGAAEAGAEPSDVEGGAAPMPWRGADGEPLPFADEPELLEFLASAPVVSEERIRKGINSPLKLLLERDGVRLHSIFRTVSTRSADSARPDRRSTREYRDSYLFECAAYELDRLLGIGKVPPATQRRHGGREGSIQIWVEEAFDERERRRRRLEPPEAIDWFRQQSIRRVFDALIYNYDRNQENMLIDRDWNLWLIDHTRSFLADPRLPERQRIEHCEHGLWERLQTVDRERVARVLEPYLNRAELEALLSRWEELIERIRGLIELRGESAVLLR